TCKRARREERRERNLENIEELWALTLENIKEHISKPSFETWLKDTKANKLDEDTLTIAAPNEFARDWLEGRYTNLISDILLEITGARLTIRFTVPDSNAAQEDIKPAPKPVQGNTQENNPKTMLNPKYTFDTFVIGSGNRFAHAASLAVAEDPARAYNPLFIYGGVGLGKTHLMHAIGHYVREHDPGANVLYLSSEKFTNEFINAIMDNKTINFRNKYRNVDVLLIDDIQFIAGKESTQEEFFHTFNALHEENKQ